MNNKPLFIFMLVLVLSIPFSFAISNYRFSDKNVLIQYLSRVANNSQTLLGHWNTYNVTGGTYSPNIVNAQVTSGKNFSVLFHDYYNLTSSPPYCAPANNDLIAHANVGGIVGVSAHFRNPANNESVRNTTLNFTAVITNGTPENINFKGELALIGACMLELKNENISFIYSALHEGDGSSWFWYTNQTPDNFRALFYLVQDTLNDMGLSNNIVWLFSDNKGYYPCDVYRPNASRLDLIGFDYYGVDMVNSSEHTCYMNSNITFIVGEHGHVNSGGTPSPITYSSNLTLQALDTKFTRTAILNSYVGRWSLNNTQDYVYYMNSERIISLDEIDLNTSEILIFQLNS